MPKNKKAIPPPRELFVVVDGSGRCCICLTDLEALHSQERLASDKVYRVVLVEEIEDPRAS